MIAYVTVMAGGIYLHLLRMTEMGALYLSTAISKQADTRDVDFASTEAQCGIVT
jgi:hypothetical protein